MSGVYETGIFFKEEAHICFKRAGRQPCGENQAKSSHTSFLFPVAVSHIFPLRGFFFSIRRCVPLICCPIQCRYSKSGFGLSSFLFIKATAEFLKTANSTFLLSNVTVASQAWYDFCSALFGTVLVGIGILHGLIYRWQNVRPQLWHDSCSILPM